MEPPLPIRIKLTLMLLALVSHIAMLVSCDDESPSPTETDNGAETGADAGPITAYFDQCVPGEAPDEACYAETRDPDSEEVALALEIAQRFMDEHSPDSLAWNWEEGVFGYSLVELYRVTSEPDLLTYLQAWIDHHIERGYTIMWSDSCPPAITALLLYSETGDEKYRQVVEDVLTYLYEQAPRTAEGGISHVGMVAPGATTLWLDSLFMFGMVLVRWGEFADDQDAFDEVRDQYSVFFDLMQEPSGWLTHAYYSSRDPQEEGVFWARGNSWVTAAGHDYLRALLLRGEDDPVVIEGLGLQVAAIVATQDAETGLWWTVPDRPDETYLETSASALFAYGLARGYRYGLRDEGVLEAVHKAVAGLHTRIIDDESGRPLVSGTSIGTSVGDFEHYAGIEVEDDVPYGVGSAILLLLEASGLPE